jgi:hypothetical protein
VVVRFGGETLTWRVQVAGGQLSEAVVNSNTKLCDPIQPIVECVSIKRDGSSWVRIGYQNSNGFTLQVPVGAQNAVEPAPNDKGQPTEFYAGRNLAVTEIPVASLEAGGGWTLNGIKGAIDATVPRCAGECTEVNLVDVKGQLDEIALEMSGLIKKAAAILRQAKIKAMIVKRDGKLIKRTKMDEVRSQNKADNYIKTANELIKRFPQVAQVCPERPLCREEDNWFTIMNLRKLYAQSRNTGIRITARTNFVTIGATKRNERIVRKLRGLEKRGNQALDKLPRVASDCG